MRILILNGPNLNMLGQREPEIYGEESFESYLQKLVGLFPEVHIDYTQSNHEGTLIDALQDCENYDTVVFNPAAFSHTSIALADTVRAIDTPVVEVHISDIYQREPYRQNNYVRTACAHSIVGEGLDGYRQAIAWAINRIGSQGPATD